MKLEPLNIEMDQLVEAASGMDMELMGVAVQPVLPEEWWAGM